MDAEGLLNISVIFLILAMIFLAAAVAMFFLLKIASVIRERSEKKAGRGEKDRKNGIRRQALWSNTFLQVKEEKSRKQTGPTVVLSDEKTQLLEYPQGSADGDSLYVRRILR